MSTPHEPLTPEERALAVQLSKLGPHGGPSPRLDARILASARASVDAAPAAGAASPKRRPRWPLGMGVAASVLLAAGIAWQLRPVQEAVVAGEESAAASAPASVAMLPEPPAEAADTAAATDATTAAPPQADAVIPPPAPKIIAAPKPASKPKAAPPADNPARRNAEAAARQESAPSRGPLSIIPSLPGVPAPAAPQAFPEAPAVVSASLPPPPPVADAAGGEGTVRPRTEQEQSQQAKRLAPAREADTLDSIVVTGARVRGGEKQRRASQGFHPPAPAAPPAPPPPAASAGLGAEPSAARTALSRTDLQVPVEEDARLPRDEWLERIRLRRDLGDTVNATRSLHLYVQEHPFQRVPDDLRPLLGQP